MFSVNIDCPGGGTPIPSQWGMVSTGRSLGSQDGSGDVTGH